MLKKGDYRGTPTEVCPCGSRMWKLNVMFEDRKVAMYTLDMECVCCGSYATAPTEVDEIADL